MGLKQKQKHGNKMEERYASERLAGLMRRKQGRDCDQNTLFICKKLSKNNMSSLWAAASQLCVCLSDV